MWWYCLKFCLPIEKWLFMVDNHYWKWSLSHTQVYGSDIESNVTLKR